MIDLIRGFDELGANDLPIAGGKGANLGELVRAGVSVPGGFCVTTNAFRIFVATAHHDVYAPLDGLGDDLEAVRRAGAEVRGRLNELDLPHSVVSAIADAWRTYGAEHGYAVRSSATAEDLPDASFAGQQDTYLNVRGRQNIERRVKDCFVSLFTDRAILYRIRNGFDHRHVAIAAVVQRMVHADTAGTMFTADPTTGHRDIVSIDASFGLGEAVVSGKVTPDHYRVDRRTDEILERHVATKRVTVRSLPEGGTHIVELADGDAVQPALSDAHVLELARMGAEIETWFGAPQDIEWVVADGNVHVTQSRPITSLFPLPEPAAPDDALNVYVSLSHFQVMTDALPAVSLSTLRTLMPLGNAPGEIAPWRIPTAGGRIYADVSPLLRHPLGRRFLLRAFGNADQRAVAAMRKVADRPEIRRGDGERYNPLRIAWRARRNVRRAAALLIAGDPDKPFAAATKALETEPATMQDRLASTESLAERVERGAAEVRRLVDIVLNGWAHGMIAGVASLALTRALMRGTKGVKDDLAAVDRGLVGNVQTKMNLAVGDLGDLARTSDAVLDTLQRHNTPAAARLEAVSHLPQGQAFLDAWHVFLDEYGARGPSEIDLQRPRWSEDPSSLLQMVMNAAEQGSAGAHREHHQRLMAEGERAAERLVRAARRSWWGVLKGPIVRRTTRLARRLMALREHHKFLAVKTFAILKPAILEAGGTLADRGVLAHADDVFHLELAEIVSALRSSEASLQDTVSERKRQHERYRQLKAPRVMTNRGEMVTGALPRGEASDDALVGSGVSGGTAEGVARVVLDPARASLAPGEILVAPFTDPGWTPLFVNAGAVVTEVGGAMTHGSLVAREYGIPAVVGVDDATERIASGQWIRVDGDSGWVEVLDRGDGSSDRRARASGDPVEGRSPREATP